MGRSVAPVTPPHHRNPLRLSPRCLPLSASLAAPLSRCVGCWRVSLSRPAAGAVTPVPPPSARPRPDTEGEWPPLNANLPAANCGRP